MIKILVAGILGLGSVGAVFLATGRPVPFLVVVAWIVLALAAVWIEKRRSAVQPQADEHAEPSGEKTAPARGGGFEHDAESMIRAHLDRILAILRGEVTLGDLCRRCGGCGLDPRWTDDKGDYEPCDDCGGGGVVVR